MKSIFKRILAGVSAFAAAAGAVLCMPSANIEADAYYVYWGDIVEEEEEVEAEITYDFDVNNFTYDTDTNTYVYTVSSSKSSNSSKNKVKKLTCTDTTGTTAKLQWKANSKASYYKAYMYLADQNKYGLWEKFNASTSHTITGLKPETTYKFCLRAFNSKDKVLSTEYVSFTTTAGAPKLKLSSSGGSCTISWTAAQKDACGYELYYLNKEYRTWYNESPKASDIKEKGFALLKSSDKTASEPLGIKNDKQRTFVVRTYKLKNGKKVYSDFSVPKQTMSEEAYVNALTLKPTAVVKGEEYDLTKKYIDQWITPGMSNYEKFDKILTEVNSHGSYQNDITKINGNRNVWQIMEKGEGQCATWAFCCYAMMEYVGFDIRVPRGVRPSGQQHFWCQIQLDGKWYDFDPHIGYGLSENVDNQYRDYQIKEYFG